MLISQKSIPPSANTERLMGGFEIHLVQNPFVFNSQVYLGLCLSMVGLEHFVKFQMGALRNKGICVNWQLISSSKWTCIMHDVFCLFLLLVGTAGIVQQTQLGFAFYCIVNFTGLKKCLEEPHLKKFIAISLHRMKISQNINPSYTCN